MGLLLVCNGLYFLENSTCEIPLLLKKQVIASGHIVMDIYSIDQVVEQALLFLLVCDLDEKTCSPPIIRHRKAVVSMKYTGG